MWKGSLFSRPSLLNPVLIVVFLAAFVFSQPRAEALLPVLSNLAFQQASTQPDRAQSQPSPADTQTQSREDDANPAHSLGRGTQDVSQTTPAPKRQSESNTLRKPVTIDERVKHFAQALGLTDTQQLQLKAILDRRRSETLRLRNATNLTGSERVDAFRELQDQTVRQIRGVLNEEQKKKYDPMTARKLQQENQESAKDWLKHSSE